MEGDREGASPLCSAKLLFPPSERHQGLCVCSCSCGHRAAPLGGRGLRKGASSSRKGPATFLLNAIPLHMSAFVLSASQPSPTRPSSNVMQLPSQVTGGEFLGGLRDTSPWLNPCPPLATSAWYPI